MSEWLHPTTRWAIYLRDDLACGYCRTTMHQLLDDIRGENFLTIDHVVRGKGNDPSTPASRSDSPTRSSPFPRFSRLRLQPQRVDPA